MQSTFVILFRIASFHRTSRPFWRKSLLVFMAFLMILPLEAMTGVTPTAKASAGPKLNGVNCPNGGCPPQDFGAVAPPGGRFRTLLDRPGEHGDLPAVQTVPLIHGNHTGETTMLVGASQSPTIAMTSAPIVLLRGAASETVTDLHLPGPAFDWEHVRSYDSHIDVGEVEESTSPSGVRWHSDVQGPYLYMTGTNDIQVKSSASTYREFKYDDGTDWTPPADFNGTLTKRPYSDFYDDTPGPNKHSGPSGSSDLYVLTNHDTGVILIFDDFQGSGRARLYERRHRQYPADQYGITYDYSGNEVFRAVTADPQAYYIHYLYDNGRLDAVCVYSQFVSYPAGDDNYLVMRADYTYFDSMEHSADLGSDGDLVRVRVASKPSGGTDWIVRNTLYRYYTEDDPEGSAHQLKGVYEADAIQRIVDHEESNYPAASDSNAHMDAVVESLLDANDATEVIDEDPAITMKEMASRWFTYYVDYGNLSLPDKSDTESADTPWDSTEDLEDYGGTDLVEYNLAAKSGMVRTEKVTGACSCSGGSAPGGITHTYHYMSLNGGPGQGTPPAPSVVVQIVVEDTEDADGTPVYRRLYGLNHSGMAIRTAFVEAPEDTPLKAWCASQILDSNFRITERRMPSAHKGLVTNTAQLAMFLNPTGGTNPNDNDDDTLQDHDGVVYKHGYDNTTKNLLWTKLRYKTGGMSSTDYLLQAYEWGDGNDDPVYMLMSTSYFPTKETDPAEGIKYLHDYEYWGDPEECQVKKVTSTAPLVGTGENGPNTTAVKESYLDIYGRVRWTKDEEGYVNYYSYHPSTGNLAYVALDVPDSYTPDDDDAKWVDVTDGDPDPNGLQPDRGRGGSLPGALAIVAKGEFDAQGRPMLVTTPGGKKHATRYFYNGVARYPYVDMGNVAQLPATVMLVDQGGNVDSQYAVAAGTANADTASLPASTSGDVSRTDYTYNAVNGQLAQVDRYHDVDGSSGEGTDKQFYGTRFLYDAQGRLGATVQFVDASRFQVYASDFDVLGRHITSRRKVTTTVPTDYADAVTQTTVTGELTYDEGDVGDGHLTATKVTHTIGGDYTYTKFHRTYRGQLRGTRQHYNSTSTPVGPYAVRDIDWSGRTTASAMYPATASISWPTTDADYVYDFTNGEPDAADHYNLSVVKYDARGQHYQTLVYPGESDENHFVVNRYHDRRGNLVCAGEKYSAHREYAYDGVGRLFQERVVLDPSWGGFYSSGKYQYCDPKPVPGTEIASGNDGNEGVMELVHAVFDSAGRITQTHKVQVVHNDAYGVDFQTTGDYIRSTTHYWHDSFDRVSVSAYYGSGNGTSTDNEWEYTSAPSYNPGSPPSTSDAKKLVTLYGYDSVGRRDLVTDPAGRKTKTFFDDFGRRVAVAENWVDYANSGTTNAGPGDQDRVTRFFWNGAGSLNKLSAVNVNSGGTEEQDTLYEYANDYHAGLATKVIYPDSSSGSDVVQLTHHLNGTPATRTDQRGVVMTFAYDNLWRSFREDATTIPSGVYGGSSESDAVRSIVRTFDDLGRLYGVKSTNTAGGGGTILNDTGFDYNQYGQLEHEWQAHGGEVFRPMGPTPKVSYAYDAAVDGNDVFKNGLRRTKTIYPNGRIIHSVFGSDESHTDRLHRLVSFNEDSSGSPGASLTEYDYLGAYQHAVSRFSQPKITSHSDIGEDGTYEFFDRFGRQKEITWDGFDTNSDRYDQILYSYDYAGNRLTRDIAVRKPNGTANLTGVLAGADNWDQEFSYDGLHRLTGTVEGTGDLSTHLVSTPTFEQQFGLDHLGNWQTFSQDDDGGGFELVQSRVHNVANETGTIEATTGTNWADSTHDAAGNMTNMPAPTNPAQSRDATYDAWNRLIVFDDGGGGPDQTNRYDGLHRRIVRTAGGFTSRHFYYNHAWQCLEERPAEVGVALKQYVWHPYYIDALAVSFNSSFETHYYTHDANFNVTAAIDESGDVVERYTYTPYGQVRYHEPDFDLAGTQTSLIENEFLFTGRRLDPESGLYYFRNRYYHAQLGRFVNRDPIGYAGGDMNLYGYVGGMPTGTVDPLGLAPPGSEIDPSNPIWNNSGFNCARCHFSVNWAENMMFSQRQHSLWIDQQLAKYYDIAGVGGFYTLGGPRHPGITPTYLFNDPSGVWAQYYQNDVDHALIGYAGQHAPADGEWHEITVTDLNLFQYVGQNAVPPQDQDGNEIPGHWWISTPHGVSISGTYEVRIVELGNGVDYQVQIRNRDLKLVLVDVIDANAWNEAKGNWKTEPVKKAIEGGADALLDRGSEFRMELHWEDKREGEKAGSCPKPR